jgi:hypothetical protein
MHVGNIVCSSPQVGGLKRVAKISSGLQKGCKSESGYESSVERFKSSGPLDP